MEMPIPTDWNGEDCCRWVVYWPDSQAWKAILYGLLEQPSRGRFWDAATGNIIDTQESFRPFYNLNFELEEVLMSCNDSNIATALQAIAQAIVTASANASASSNATANACCEQTIINQGGGVVGGYTQPGTGEDLPIFGTEPPLTIDPETYPDGYDSLEEYQIDKCEVANLVVTGFTGSLRGLGALGVFNAVAVAGLIVVAITGIIVFPPALVPIAAAAIGMLTVEVTLLTLLANYVDENREQWVCAIYNSDSVEGALQLISDLLDGAIAAIETTGPTALLVKQIALLLLNGDTLNQLFRKTAHLTYPDADCSACACELVRFDFDDDEDGYAYAADSCFGTTPSTATSSVTWSGGALVMDAPNVGATNAVNAQGASIDKVIRAGDLIEVTGRRIINNNNYVRIDVVTTESGCVQAGTGGYLYTGQSTIVEGDISALVGETLERVNLYVNNSTSQAVSVSIEQIYVGCPRS